MTQGATHGGARDVCAFTVSAKAVARETGAQGERFWSSHIGSATAAAMFVPALTILILVCHPRQGSQVLRRESPPRAIGSPSVGSRPLDHASHGRTRTSSCSLAGRILDTQGEPSAHATVRAVAVGEGAPISAAIADDDGRFCLTAPAMSRARIVAEDDGDGLVESAEVESGATHDVVLVLGHAVRLTGVVLDERDAPVAQAKVKSWGGSAGTEKIATTDDEGRYVIERVAPGASRVTAWGPGYGPTTVAAPRDGATLNVTLRASRPVRGIVTGPTGRPVAGARIAACEQGPKEETTSDAFGKFELPAVTAGCTASASHPRFSAARPVSIEAGRDLIVRLATGGAIEGAVLDGRGAPVNSFSVSIESYAPAEGESEEAGRAGETRDELRGSFRFDGLAAGTYVVHATTPEGATSESKTVEVPRGKVVRGIRFRLGDAVTSSSEEAPTPEVTPTPEESAAPEEAAAPEETPSP